MSLCEFEVSESGAVRGAVRADVAILGVGVMKSAGFWEKVSIFAEICGRMLDKANRIGQNVIIRGALMSSTANMKLLFYFRRGMALTLKMHSVPLR